MLKINIKIFTTAFLVLFILFTYIGLQPFMIGASDADLLVVGESNSTRQLFYILFFLMSFFLYCLSGKTKFERMRDIKNTMAVVLILLWCILSSIWALYPEVSFKRSALLALSTLTVFFLVSSLEREVVISSTAKLLAFLLIVSFLSIPIIDSAVHDSAEIFDSDLAGNWRGIFSHKNDAGPAVVFGIFFFIAMYFQSRKKIWLYLVPIAVTFVFFTKSKTSLGILFPSIIFGLLSIYVVKKDILVKIFTVIFVMLIFTFFVLNDFLLSIFTNILNDPMAFTGRSTIWDMMFSAILDKPFLGYGYGSVWSVDDKMILTNYEFGRVSWVFLLTQGHNSYLDLTLAIGLIGLLIFVFTFIVSPFLNSWKFSAIEPSFTFLFWSILFFVSFHSLLETNFLLADKGRWVVFLMVFLMYRLHPTVRFKT